MSRFGTRRRHLAVAFALAAFLSLAAVALGAHWPMQGGDAGRSGYQPQAPTGLPVKFKYAKTDTSDQNIRTSIITTAGSTTNQRMAYSTTNGRVHQQVLATGAAVGPEGGVDINDQTLDTDIFGSGVGNVAPVDSSTATQLGNIFQVHNDDNQDFATSDPRRGGDIALASVFASAGLDLSIVGFDDTIGANECPSNASCTTVPNTINFSVNAPPLITAPTPSGQRDIYFSAIRATAAASQSNIPCALGQDFEAQPPQNNEAARGCNVTAARRLFKVTVADANTSNASVVNVVMSGNISDLNTDAAPALVNLDTGSGAKPHIIVGTIDRTNSDAKILSFDADTLAPGSATGNIGDAVWGISAPVNADGTIPASVPYFFAAVEQLDDDGTADPEDDFRVVRLLPDMSIDDDSPFVQGNPSPGLTVTQTLGQNGQPGRVVTTSSYGFHSFSASDLSKFTASATGGPFTKTVPASSGNLVFAMQDNGNQMVVDATTLDEVPATAAGFQENAGNDTATGAGSWGQPSISNRFVQFGSDNGAFVYEASNPTIPGTAGPAYSIGDATATEGDSGEKIMTFKVTRFGPNSGPSTVKVSTQDGTAKAGQDYVAFANQLVSFAAGETEKNVGVTILSEAVDESDETFFLNLSEPTGTGSPSIIDSQGVGVIVSDDPRQTAPGEPVPLIDVSDVVAVEGGSAVFTVAMSNASSRTVTVKYATSDESAKAGLDYGGGSGTLTYTPGQTVKTISVPIVADNVKESLERFFLNLSEPVNGNLSDNQGSAFLFEKGYDLPRVAPKISSSTKPRKDTRAPFRFTTTGRVRRPSGVPRAEGCKGKVSVQIKALPAKTISNRTVKLRSNCRFTSRVTFKNRKRFPKNGRLEVHTRFAGNDRLLPKRARKHLLRTK